MQNNKTAQKRSFERLKTNQQEEFLTVLCKVCAKINVPFLMQQKEKKKAGTGSFMVLVHGKPAQSLHE